MKRMILMLTGLIALMFSLTVFASEESSLYIEAKGGMAMIRAEGFDNGYSYSGIAGFHFDKNFGCEIDIGNFEADPKDLKGTYYGVYATGTVGEEVYLKLKAGGVHEKVKLWGLSAEDDGLSGGVSVGFKITPEFSVEAEYLYIESDVATVSLGAGLHF